MKIAALSIDAAWLRGLPRAPRSAQVHSVFDRVVNLIADDGRLLTLAWRDADDAPDSAVVDLGTWSALGLSGRDPVHLSATRIELPGGLTIALDSARPWAEPLPRYAADDSTLRAWLPLAREHLARHGTGVGTERRPAASAGSIEAVMRESFARITATLCNALDTGDEALARDQLERLVGLGPGLTPAGDDFLVGLLAALNLPHSPASSWRRIGEHVARCAERQTHLISATALRQAARGRVRARVIELCHALMHGTPSSMRGALQRVMAIGSGSGSDMALGVLAGFERHLHATAQARAVLCGRHAVEALHDVD